MREFASDSPSLNITDFCPSGRCLELPSRLSTPTGTITVGGVGKPPANCCKGGIVEQYSIGLFGLGCLPYNHLSNTPNSGDWNLFFLFFFSSQPITKICIENQQNRMRNELNETGGKRLKDASRIHCQLKGKSGKFFCILRNTMKIFEKSTICLCITLTNY